MYTRLVHKINDLVYLLEDSNLTNQQLVIGIIEGGNIEMKDIEKANTIIIKKYGKNLVKSYKFPCDMDCEYACTAHNQCLCLFTYYRPILQQL